MVGCYSVITNVLPQFVGGVVKHYKESIEHTPLPTVTFQMLPLLALQKKS